MSVARAIAPQATRSVQRERPPARLPAALLPMSTVLQEKPSCACGGGCPRCRANADHSDAGMELRPQAKLAVGPAHDPLEQEADRIADEVLTASSHREDASAVRVTPRVQRATGAAGATEQAAPASVAPVLAGDGRPLAPSLRADMERRFGHDLSRVVVHSGAAAERSAQDLNANAYTVGHHVVFGAGRWEPNTYEGRLLIAHELAHVAQQTAGGAAPRVQRQGKAAPKPANNPVCTRICGTGTPATPQTVTIGQNVFTLCPCTVSQVNFNTGPGYVDWVTKVSEGLPAIDPRKLNFRTGFQGKNVANTTPAWEYTAGVGVDEAIPGGGATRETELFTGFIQTIESYTWHAVYGSNWERNLSEANVRDAQKGAGAPWYGTSGGHDAPKQIGTSQVNLTDEPQVILSVTHPDASCAKLQEVTTEGTFNLWLIAAETANATTNLAYLYHATVTFDRKFSLKAGADPSSTLSWNPTGAQKESNAGYGAGSKTPVLDTPTPTLTFTTKKGTPC